jgi:hypothetical protein
MPWDLTGNPDGDIGPNNFLGTRANDPLRIRTRSSVNNADAMTITPAPDAATTGNVGIGTNNPAARLTVAGGGAIIGSGGSAALKVRHIDGKHWQNDNNDTLYLNWATTLPVAIGQSAARASLLVSADATIGWGSNGVLRTRHIDGKHWQNDNNDGLFLNWATGQPVYIGGAQLATLTVNGNLGTAGFPPTPRTPGWGGGLHTWDVEAEGTIWSMNGYNEGSDARMKANVAKLGNVLDKLDAIRGVSFERIRLGAPTARAEQRRDIGVIAQEVETVFPELVSVHGHENNKAVNYSGLTGVLIEAVKDLKAQNEALRSRIEALERA